MKHCGQKPPIYDLCDSNDGDNPCLRAEGHADGLHIMYDQYAKQFSTWQVDYNCECDVEIECESCIKSESLSLKELITWLDRDFRGNIPKEVMILIDKFKEKMDI